MNKVIYLTKFIIKFSLSYIPFLSGLSNLIKLTMQKNIIIRETQKKLKYFSLVKKNKFISSKAFMFIADSLSYDIRSSTPNYIVPTFKNREFINSKYIYC